MKGYSFSFENIFYTFKNNFCPVCGNKLSKENISEIVNSQSSESKNYDFDVADVTIKGDMKFTHIEFYCNQCNKYYSIKETKKNKF